VAMSHFVTLYSVHCDPPPPPNTIVALEYEGKGKETLSL
jgi:hypothetical protein